MQIKPIKTEKDYDKALERLELIFDASPNSKEGDEAEILSLLIENKNNNVFMVFNFFVTGAAAIHQHQHLLAREQTLINLHPLWLHLHRLRYRPKAQRQQSRSSPESSQYSHHNKYQTTGCQPLHQREKGQCLPDRVPTF